MAARAWWGWSWVAACALLSCQSSKSGPPDGGGDEATLNRTAAPNPIPAENARPGDSSWLSAGREASAGQVEVYLSTDTGEAGDTISAKVSSDAAVTATIFRLGYYQGTGARKIWTGGPFNAQRQATCPLSTPTALIECTWQETFSFQISADWVSGLYLLKVERADGLRRFAPFVVRDHRAAELLFQAAFNDYQAYNTWGGESLYVDASGTMPKGRANEVSFNRPFRDGEGSGQMLRWEYWLVKLLERDGYDVTYSTNLDFSRYRDVLGGIGAFVFGGHDEYWTAEERDQVDAAIRAGTSVAYFGANGAYQRIRFRADSAGKSLRTIVCFKNEPTRDPIPNSTIRFRDPPNAKPENQLFGSMYDSWELVPFPMLVGNPSHWLFQGTGLNAGDLLPGLVGYEFDRAFPDLNTPAGASVIMESAVVSAEGVPSVSDVMVRNVAAGTIVFSAGSIFWPIALSSDQTVADGRVVRMTENVLEQALAHRRAARPLPPSGSERPLEFPTDAQWAQSVDAFAGVVGSAAPADGPGPAAQFSGPTGLAVTATGQVIVADTRSNRIRLIGTDASRTVSTVAGTGELGNTDGPGAQARFRAPTGVAAGSAGIFVADSDNHVIRQIQLNPPTWTVSTYAGVPRSPGYADGAAATAKFNRPTAIAIDGQGNLCVTEQAGQRIRMISAATQQVTTLAGSGQTGFADAASGLQAQFNGPSAITLAPDGAVYVIDSANRRIRRIAPDSSHAVTTVAGGELPFGYADGPASQARFRAQMGLAMNSAGELLIADTANFRIRKLVRPTDPTAHVYTIAGSGKAGTNLGPAGTADLAAPAGLAILPDRRILVSDSFHNVIRAITP